MILVFGSLNMDLIMEVAALPHRGETALSPGYVMKPGGKGGNQAVAAARAGADVMMAGCVGDDEFGRLLMENLKANRVATGGIRVATEPTGIATICVDRGGDNVITVAAGANFRADLTSIPEAWLGFSHATVLMQMEVPPEQNWALIRHAHEVGARSILNVAPAAPVPRGALDALDVLIVNEVEAAAVSNTLGLSRHGPKELARGIADEAKLTCIITLGHRGAVAASDGDLWLVDRMPVEAADTTGAGDAFTGILAAALDDDDDLATALRRASVGAGLSCLTLGAQDSLPTNDAINANLHRVPPPRRNA